MRRRAGPDRILRRMLLLLLGACGMGGLVIGAALIRLYALDPPCWHRSWRMGGDIVCHQTLWIFGPTLVQAVAILAAGLAACLVMAGWRRSRRPRRA